MPGMFSRRRASSAQPPVSRSTASAAAVAATAAYYNTTPNPSLSSAAAAAALRSHTTTPEPVGSLQTKRMTRRGSVASSITSVQGRGASLQRNNSSGSMSERTFRVASPGPARRNGAISPPPAAAPPVPAMPKTLRNGPSKRSSSTEPPQRVTSPTPANGRRSFSVDKGGAGFQRTLRPSSRLADVPELAMPRSRNSVNFSRPREISPEPSPVTQPGQRSGGGWHAGPIGAATDATQSSAGASAKQTPRKGAPPPLQRAGSQEMGYTMVFDLNTRTFVRSARPTPVSVAEPPSPIVDTAPKLKPGDYDPATRSIVPFPKTVKQDGSGLAPPPRNPARLSPENSPAISPRPAGLLHKQPSVVREDPDAERAAEAASPSPMLPRPATSYQTSSAPSKTYKAAGGHQRSASLEVPNTTGNARSRGDSQSPSRNTRFSASPVTEATMHEPHRGISPAKSALKHSPSSSLRAASPVATFSPLPAAQSAPSDVSDTTSLASEGGSAVKKKRSVRVSFDDSAPVPALPVTKAATPAKLMRPADVTSDDDEDESMRPRPELPTFGSVRKNKAQNDAPEKVTEPTIDRAPITSNEAAVAAPTEAKDTSPAKEVAVAAPTLAKDTSTADVTKEITVLPTNELIDNTKTVDTATNGTVPAINLSPPTPATEHKDLTDDETSRMSESQELSKLASGLIFYGDESDDSRSRRLSEDRPAPAQRKDSDADVYTDAPETQDATDNNKTGYASLDAIVESPMTSPVKANAPKDGPLTDGKASPESPNGDWTAATAYWSKLTKEKRAQHERDHLSSDDETKKKRSFFKRNKKTKDIPTSNAKATTDTESTPITQDHIAPESPRAASALSRPIQPVPPPFTSSQAAKPAVKSIPPPATATPPLKPALKKTTRAPAASDDEGVHMPRTMRGAGASTRPMSAMATSSGSVPTMRTRPASVGQSGGVNAGARSTRGPAPISASSHTASKFGKKFKDDSDSESSFKKKRRGGSSADGRYSMRRSMRAGSIDSTSRVGSPPPGSMRNSILRSLSPSSVTSGRGERAESLRQSLRGAPPQAAARTMRGNKAAQSKAPSTSMSSRFKSRFADSDSEDDGPRGAAQPAYRSRFVDSDDEDDTIREELTPVRGIPRRKGQEDGDSTDLEDESDGGRARRSKKNHNVNAIVTDPADVEKAMDAARRKLGMADPKTGAQTDETVQQRTPRDRDNDKVYIPMDMMSDVGSVSGANGQRKRGFMSSFLRRNRSSSQSVAQVGSQPPPLPPVASPKLDTSTPQSAITQKVDSPSSPSTAKLVRRSSYQPPRLQRGNSSLSTATAPAAHGRGTMSDEHWPLPPPVPSNRMDSFKDRDSGRPQTSDDAIQSTHPRVGFTDEAIAHSERTESEAGSNANPVYSVRTGRKKKFGLLRRAFGLYD